MKIINDWHNKLTEKIPFIPTESGILAALARLTQLQFP